VRANRWARARVRARLKGEGEQVVRQRQVGRQVDEQVGKRGRQASGQG
jgi:hypothetical protein